VTHKQRAIDDLVERRREQADRAKSSPVRAVLAAAAHVLGGIAVAAMSVFGGLRLGFPWWASAFGLLLAFFVAAPNVARTAVSWLIGAIRDGLAARKESQQ